MSEPTIKELTEFSRLFIGEAEVVEQSKYGWKFHVFTKLGDFHISQNGFYFRQFDIEYQDDIVFTYESNAGQVEVIEDSQFEHADQPELINKALEFCHALNPLHHENIFTLDWKGSLINIWILQNGFEIHWGNARVHITYKNGAMFTKIERV